MFLFDITCMVKSLIIKIQIIHFPFLFIKSTEETNNKNKTDSSLV